MSRKNYSHTIPPGHVRQKYRGGPAVAPVALPPAAAAVLTPGSVPQNLRCVTSTDPAKDKTLVWDGTPATSALGTLARYEIQLYSLLPPVASIPAGTTQWQVTAAADDHDPTFTVRAVYAMNGMAGGNGMETPSIPSNQCRSVCKMVPLPSYFPTSLPTPVANLTVTSYWNEGKPLNHLQWSSSSEGQWFDVVRDNVLVAEGLWVLEYTDHDLLPGASHTYTVYKTVPQASPKVISPGASVTGAALSAAPAFDQALVPQNVTLYRYDGSVLFECDTPYGFEGPGVGGGPGKQMSLRAHNVLRPDNVKFSGDNPHLAGLPLQRRSRIAILVNCPGGGDFAFGFCDKSGPDVVMNPDAPMTMNGMVVPTNTNGHGPPAFVPVLAGPEVVYHFDGQPQAGCISILRGDPARGFTTSFQGTQQPVKLASAQYPPAFAAAYARAANKDDFALYDTPEFISAGYLVDVKRTAPFFMNGHFMAWVMEGGTPGTGNPAHQANGALYNEFKHGFQLRPNEVLRLFLVTSNPVNGRVWTDLFIKALADPFYNPGKFFEFNDFNTASGNLIRAEMTNNKTLKAFYPASSPYVGKTSTDTTSNGPAPRYKYNHLIGEGTAEIVNQISLADWHEDCPQEMELYLMYRADGSMKACFRTATRYTNDLTLQGGGANRGGVEFLDWKVLDASIKYPWYEAPDTTLAFAFEQLAYHQELDGRGEVMDYSARNRFRTNHRPYRPEWHILSAGIDIFPAGTAWPLAGQ